MNCPFHCLIFRSRGRSYRELPLRLFEFGSVYRYEKSGRRPRPDPGPRDDPGRRAHLRAPPSRSRRSSRACSPSCSTCSRTTASTTSTSSCRPEGPGQVHRLRRASGRPRPRPCTRWPVESGLELVPDPGGAAFYGPKISVQARDAIGRTWQMSTIQLDFFEPERFGLEYTGRRRVPAAAGDDPPRAVRVDRAVHRGARRALRRRVPAVAGARCRSWRSRSPSGTRTTSPERRRAQMRASGHPGRGRRLGRPDAEEDPQRAAAEGAVHADRRRPRRRGGRRVVPLPRRRPGQRRTGRRGDRANPEGGRASGSRCERPGTAR